MLKTYLEIKMKQQSFTTISTSSLVVKKSKFESQLYSISTEEDISSIIEHIKTQHPKATHICYCTIFNSEVVIKNDREVGNPANIMHNIMFYNHLNSHLLVTIRYFGGVKLGVGGVMSAFKTCAGECVKNIK